MPFDGSGNYAPAAAPNFPAIGGTTISSTYYNAVINDLATALNNVLTRDGQGRPSAAQNWNGQNLTNVNTFAAVSASFTNALPVTSGGTGVTTATGSGSVVLATSPTLVTPNLGTPSAATLTNATGLPIVAGTTGTLSVARGGTGVTTSTGTGAVVLSTSPVLVTPTLGVASATSLATGLGAAGTPSHTFTGDTDTGMWSPGPDSIAWSEGGAEVMRIDSSGRFGVGTPGPGAKVDIVGPTLTPATQGTYALWIANTGGANGDLAVGSDATYGYIQSFTGKPLYLNSLGNNVLVGAGNLGVGTINPTSKLQVVGTVNFSGALTSGDLADAVGYKGLPQNSRTAAYTLVLADMGKHISITTGGVTIPANSVTAFPIGTALSIYNDSAVSQNININTDTLLLAGTGSGGAGVARALAQRGLATLLKVAATTWIISGAGVS